MSFFKCLGSFFAETDFARKTAETVEKVRVRARDARGRFIADDPKTKDYNEAYVGGKAPKDLLGLKKRKK